MTGQLGSGMSPEPGGPGPTLVVIGGRQAGLRLVVPAGETSVGRDATSELVLDDDGVSRHHAMLVRAAQTVTIEDVGSTNGTWVNGDRVTSARELRQGDRIQLGTALLALEGGAPTPPASAGAPPAAASSKRRLGRVRVGRVILIGGLANLILVGAGVVIQFATDWTGIGTWLAAPLTGMVAATVALMKDALTKPPEEAPPAAAPPAPGAPAPAPVSPPSGAPATPRGATAPTGVVPPPRRGGVSVLVGVLVAVLVIGVGGVAVTYAVATVSGFITGNQVGVDRLESPVAVDSGGIVTTVERVEHTADFTRVELTVRNDLANTVTLPVYGNATLSAEDGTTLEADAFRSSWSDTIPPGQLRRGTIVFNGHLPDAGTTAALSFATVFEQGFSGPSSIVVPGLPIAPLGG